jgi:hypothetical protein
MSGMRGATKARVLSSVERIGRHRENRAIRGLARLSGAFLQGFNSVERSRAWYDIETDGERWVLDRVGPMVTVLDFSFSDINVGIGSA